MTADPPAHICVVLLTGLGDVVMGLPAVNSMRDHWPTARISWVAEPMPSEILQGHPSVDEIVVFEKRRGWRGVLDLRRKMAGRRFDLAINFMPYFKSIWPTVFSGAPLRLGFDRTRSRDGVWLVANRHLAPGPRRHTADMFLEFPQRLGIPTRLDWRLQPTEAERSEQAALFAAAHGRPVVGIVPASGMARKDWIASRFAEVIDVLEHDFGWRTMVLGGPGARETSVAREIVERARARPIWAMEDGVRRLAARISGCDLVIAPDTGPVHIARALEVPVIGLYGHTNPWRVGPFRKFQDLWVDRYTDPDEPPDPSRFDPKHERMERITAGDVLERVERARAAYGVG